VTPIPDHERQVAVSKYLAYLLRHHPEAAGLTLDEHGWVDLDDLIAALATSETPVTGSEIESLLDAPGKPRFEIDGRRLRAAQGHSVDVDLDLPATAPPDVLFHGTVERFLPAIMRDGLQRGRRRHVHLSPDSDTAQQVGARRGKPVVLTVDAAAAHRAGHTFYRASNGVWLTNHVPPEYLSRTPSRH
jgi:putative RNA 2'-phosphotransferase